MHLGSRENAIAQGALPSLSKLKAQSVYAIWVPALGIFGGQKYPTHDDLVIHFWDNRNSIFPTIGWEGHHNEGDTHPNADTSAWSAPGKFTKITAEEAANHLGMDTSYLTPEMCS